MENVKSKLRKNWSYPDFLEDGHIRVLFKLDKHGNVISGDILESSGNQVYDESAIDAIHKSEPFGDFPANTTRETITINYSFDSGMVKTDKMKEYYDLAKKYTYSDKKEALKYINLAIEEVYGDSNNYFLYRRRAKIKEGLGDHVGAKEDMEKYLSLEFKAHTRRLHAIKHRAEI
jgi:TonB family protein